MYLDNNCSIWWPQILNDFHENLFTTFIINPIDVNINHCYYRSVVTLLQLGAAIMNQSARIPVWPAGFYTFRMTISLAFSPLKPTPQSSSISSLPVSGCCLRLFHNTRSVHAGARHFSLVSKSSEKRSYLYVGGKEISPSMKFLKTLPCSC